MKFTIPKADIHIHIDPQLLAAIDIKLGALVHQVSSANESLRRLEAKVEALNDMAVRSAAREEAMAGFGQEALALLQEIDAATTQSATLAQNISNDTDQLLTLIASKPAGEALTEEEVTQIRALATATRDRSAALGAFLTDLASKPDAVITPAADPVPPTGEGTGGTEQPTEV